jgi:hypothetical protein
MRQDEIDQLLARLIKFDTVTGMSMADMNEKIQDQDLYPHVLKYFFILVDDAIEAKVAYVMNEDWNEYNKLVKELGG